jgi:hyperosmotically inducible periplasmic protein
MKKGKLYLLASALLVASPLFSSQPQPQSDAIPPAASVPAQSQQQEAIPALPAHKPRNAPANEEDRIAREVRHELVMQPFYTIWDWLAFRVNGNTVELVGDVASVGLKRDAVNTVKHIEGVEQVIDHINQLPPSPMDDRIRHQVAHAIFNWGGLSRYSWSAVPSIHIIVNGGRVRLEGIVDSEADKNAAGIRANGVPGIFQVTNNLKVVKS